ncbi:MAG: hypothetical protein OEW91_14785, partial [Acidimicrobiia bacterium]|nr:hypothetical protein [Acidimicrobiia bacterium]
MQQNRRSSRRAVRLLAGGIAAILVLPASAALASPGEKPDRAANHRQPQGRPAAQVDHVYRGPLDGALGTHTWSGDLYGTGVMTTVTYEIGVDDAGVPGVVSLSVDDSTVPAGVTYEIRSGTSHSTKPEPEPEPEPEPDAPVVEVSAKQSVSMVDDEPADEEPADEEP